jgi:hypothetical protein
MSEPSERTGALAPEVLDLLTAVRDALDVTGLDDVARTHRMIEVRVRLDGILSTVAIDAKHPELPGMAPRAMADAIAALRRA